MSLDAYIWAANLPLDVCNGTTFRVLLKIADRADPLGYTAFPKPSDIAKTLGCTQRTVQRAVRELLDLGLIRRGDQSYVAHLRGGNRPVVFDVMTDALKYTERATTDMSEVGS